MNRSRENSFTQILDANENVDCPVCAGEGFLYKHAGNLEAGTTECTGCYGNRAMSHWEALQSNSDYYADYENFLNGLNWDENGNFFSVPFTGNILIDLGLER